MGLFDAIFGHRKRRARGRIRRRAGQILYTRRPRHYFNRRAYFDRNRKTPIRRKNQHHVNLRKGMRSGRYRTARAPVPTQKLRH